MAALPMMASIDRDADHGRSRVGPQVGQERLCDEGLGLQVDAQGGVPDLLGHHVDRGGAGDAGAVHEPADRAQCRSGPGDGLAVGRHVAHVDPDADGRHAVLGGDGLGRGVGALLVQVPAGDGPADLGQRLGGGQSDPGCAARDDNAGGGGEVE